MYNLDPSSYPVDGREWVPVEDLEKLANQDEALLLEQYAHEVAALRRKFFAKLLSHDALHDGLGWAVFEDEPAGSVAELGSREVLMVCGAVNGQLMGDQLIPQVRILTNEPFQSEDEVAFLTEDITVCADSIANYFISAVQLKADNPQQQETALRQSSAPLFFVRDGHLRFTGNWKVVTPYVSVASDTQPDVSVLPFGSYGSLPDMAYALARANDLVDSVADILPRWHKEQ